MKKFLTCFLLCASLCAVFVSCTDNEEESTVEIILDNYDEESETYFVPVGSENETEEYELGGVPLD